MENLIINSYLVYAGVALIVILLLYVMRLKMKISISNENEIKLFQEAYFDPVTKLPNKKNIMYVFDEQISRTLRHDRAFTVLVIKINNFGKIKENSVKMADKFVYEVSNVVIKLTRDEDLVSRIDEDIFMILFNEYLEGDKYQLILKRLQDGFAGLPKGIDIECDISMGISQYPTDGTNAEVLIEKAIQQAVSKQF